MLLSLWLELVSMHNNYNSIVSLLIYIHVYIEIYIFIYNYISGTTKAKILGEGYGPTLKCQLI